MDCYREPDDKAPGVELCWDLYQRDFPPVSELSLFPEDEQGKKPAEARGLTFDCVFMFLGLGS